jgi:hypothetical protein
MSYDYITLDLTESNPLFAPLAVKGDAKQPKQWLSVPNKALPNMLSTRLFLLFSKLSAGCKVQLDEAAFGEQNTILASFADGQMNRVFGPVVYRTEGPTEENPSAEPSHLALRWGENFLPIAVDKDVFTCGAMVLEPGRAKVGRYEEVVLTAVLDLVEAEEELTVHFPVRLIAEADTKEKPMTAQRFKSMAKRDFAGFMELIALPSGGGGGGGTVYDMADLPPMADYKIIAAVKRKATWGSTYIITVQANADAGLAVDTDFWACSSIKSLLEAGAVVSEESPMLIYFDLRPNEKKPERPYKHVVIQRCSYGEQTPGEGLSLDW